MEKNRRHVVNGLKATIDSAHVVTDRDVWVDPEHLPEALRQIRKLSGQKTYKPKVYSQESQSVCIYLG